MHLIHKEFIGYKVHKPFTLILITFLMFKVFLINVHIIYSLIQKTVLKYSIEFFNTKIQKL